MNNTLKQMIGSGGGLVVCFLILEWVANNVGDMLFAPMSASSTGFSLLLFFVGINALGYLYAGLHLQKMPHPLRLRATITFAVIQIVIALVYLLFLSYSGSFPDAMSFYKTATLLLLNVPVYCVPSYWLLGIAGPKSSNTATSTTP